MDPELLANNHYFVPTQTIAWIIGVSDYTAVRLSG